jgi:hypothetical protein
LFETIGGQIVDEATKPESSSLLTARLIVQVNKQPFQDSQAQIDVWRTSDYNLYSQNCISFVRAVAVSLGLFPPEVGTLQLPTSYLEELIQQTTIATVGGMTGMNSSSSSVKIGEYEVDIQIAIRSTSH